MKLEGTVSQVEQASHPCAACGGSGLLHPDTPCCCQLCPVCLGAGRIEPERIEAEEALAIVEAYNKALIEAAGAMAKELKEAKAQIKGYRENRVVLATQYRELRADVTHLMDALLKIRDQNPSPSQAYDIARAAIAKAQDAKVGEAK